MGHVLVLFDSKTGNTAKMAQYVAEGAAKVPDIIADCVALKFALHYEAVVAGEPKREVEVASCRRLGGRLAQWVAVLVNVREELYPGPIDARQTCDQPAVAGAHVGHKRR
jgi:hypothetical protein